MAFSAGEGDRTMVLIGDPRIAAIPVVECGEAFADFHDFPGVMVDGTRQWITSTSGHFAKARASVVQRIAAASLALPPGVRLKIIEAYRPPKVQREEFAALRSRVKGVKPHLSDVELDLEASRFSAPPSVAPHPTGAAADLTLCDINGVELDMGTSPNSVAVDDSTASYTDSSEINGAAKERRAILVRALTAHGLVNYPSEWWHWSYGDRYWAFVMGQPAALYGAREEGELN
jgi:zinc D-Ala-D-Ala dipeptidase